MMPARAPLNQLQRKKYNKIAPTIFASDTFDDVTALFVSFRCQESLGTNRENFKLGTAEIR